MFNNIYNKLVKGPKKIYLVCLLLSIVIIALSFALITIIKKDKQEVFIPMQTEKFSCHVKNITTLECTRIPEEKL